MFFLKQEEKEPIERTAAPAEMVVMMDNNSNGHTKCYASTVASSSKNGPTVRLNDADDGDQLTTTDTTNRNETCI